MTDSMDGLGAVAGVDSDWVPANQSLESSALQRRRALLQYLPADNGAMQGSCNDSNTSMTFAARSVLLRPVCPSHCLSLMSQNGRPSQHFDKGAISIPNLGTVMATMTLPKSTTSTAYTQEKRSLLSLASWIVAGGRSGS